MKKIVDEDGFGPDDLTDFVPVSRETIDRLVQFVEILDKWRTTHNLIGPEERKRLWRRHILDCLQIVELTTQKGSKWIDLGSGAGFPALILASAFQQQSDTFTTVESAGKKCAFMRAASRELDLIVTVKNERIESVSRETYNYVTSRALASLPELFQYALRFLDENGQCIFQKGKDVEREIEDASKDWSFEFSLHNSASHTEGRILVVRGLTRQTS